MSETAQEQRHAEQEGVAHRVARRDANRQLASATTVPVDVQGLIELACECSRSDCERSVRVPLYVYRRMLEAGDQYLLQAGHHAFPQYRTIVSIGLTSIEERV